MPSPITRADLLDAEVVWLLTLEWAGRTWRVASRPVGLSSDDGVLSYASGLSEPNIDETLGRLKTRLPAQSASMEVVLDDDVAQWRRRGYTFRTARAEIAQVLVVAGTVQQSWENRFRVLVGAVNGVQYAEPDRPPGWMAFTIREDAWEDTNLLLPLTARIDAVTWPDAPEKSIGKVYPLVYGAPGAYTDASGSAATVPGSPAYIVEDTGTDADTLLICGEPVVATSAQVYDGTAWESFTVSHQSDGLGVRCAVIDVTGAATLDRTVSEYWVAWDGGAAVSAPATAGGTPTGLGSILRWLLGRTSIPVDHGRLAVAVAGLDAVDVGGYVNDPEITAWEYIEAELLKLYPLTVRRSPDGIVVMPHAPDVRVVDVVADITAGPSFRRVGAVQDEDGGKLVAAVRVDITNDAKDGGAQQSIRLSAENDPNDSTQSSSLHARHAAQRGGVEQSRTADVVWERSSGEVVALAWLRAHSLDTETTAWEAAKHWGWLQVGDWVAITEPSDGTTTSSRYTARVCQVIRRSYSDRVWGFELLAEEEPVREIRDA